jgi:hypothetical protein
MISGRKCIKPEEELDARFDSFNFGDIDCRAFGV